MKFFFFILEIVISLYFTLPFHPYEPFHISTLSYSPSNPWLRFHTNCSCMHICLHIYIPKYNLFSSYNVISMYAFRADHLALDNQLVVVFPRDGQLCWSQFTWPLVSCVVTKLHGLITSRFGVSAGVLLAHMWAIMLVRLCGCRC